MTEFFVRLLAGLLGLVAEVVLTKMLEGFIRPRAAGRRSMEYRALRPRNGWIYWVAQACLVAGFAAPLILSRGHAAAGWRILGLACGLLVATPYAWICLATLPFGFSRYREYWRFHRLRCGIGPIGIVVLALPFAVFGVVAAIRLAADGEWPFL